MDEQQLNYLFRLADAEMHVAPAAPHSDIPDSREDSRSHASDAGQPIETARYGGDSDAAGGTSRHEHAGTSDDPADSDLGKAVPPARFDETGESGPQSLTIEESGKLADKECCEVEQNDRLALSETDRLREAETTAIAQLTNTAGTIEVAQLFDSSAPKQTQSVSVTSSMLVDAVPETVTVRWEELVAGVWIEIKAASGLSFTPGRTHVGHQLRVVVSYTDSAGQTHTVVSVATDPVQKFAVGSGTDLDSLQGPERQAAADFSAIALSEPTTATTLSEIVPQTAMVSLRTLTGTDGPDFLSGGPEGDLIIGRAGNDTLIGGKGNDILLGGKGDDTFLATKDDGNDIVNGGEGYDTYDLSLTAADASVDLAAGTSSSAETGDDQLSDIENVIGSSGNDKIVGTEGDNVLTGGGGKDVLFGGAGDDTFRATVNDGNDVICGGDGVDTYDLSQTTSGATVDLSKGTSSSIETGDDKLSSIENAVGSSGNDTIVGTETANVLAGGDGDDILDGGAGDDTLIGGTGDDVYVVDSSGDIVIELPNQGTDTIQTSLSSFSLAELVTVEDLFFTGVGDFVGTGNELANVICGGWGSDTLSGGPGDDTLDGSGLSATTISNSGSGSSSSGSGSDHLYGGSGNDIIIGGSGNDYISGGSGDDIIIAGAGDDYIELGSGNDTIYLAVGFGNDFVIDDFDAHGQIGHQDMIDVSSYGFNSETALGSDILIGMADDGSTTITIGSDVLTLHGVGPGAISHTDFLFS